MATADVCRRDGGSSATFYKWKAENVGLEVFEARRRHSPEEENARLKRRLADAMPKKVLTPRAKRQEVAHL
ncbi:MAG: hypothetical protein E2586_09755 [Novosphingobium sp.]|nr:hypothetical protein [Novosphingobium sp.]